MSKIGHNRVGSVAVDQLKSVIARVERLEETKAGIQADITMFLAKRGAMVLM